MANERKRLDLFYIGHDRASRPILNIQKRLGGLLRFAAKASAGMGLALGGAAVAIGFKAAITAGAEFEQKMARVKALTGATGGAMENMTLLAKELGRTTVFSASQAAEAMSFFSLAGFKVNETLAAMTPTMTLAASGQLDIAEAADISAKTMRGMGIDANDLGGTVDILTKAFTTSNTTLSQLGEAMKFAGPVARSAGRDITELVSSIMVLSNAGLQAEIAGTAMRNVFLRLANPTSQAQKKMAKLGIAVEDIHGNMLPLPDIVEQFQSKLAGFGTRQKLGILGSLFERRAGTAFTIFVETGAKKMREFQKTLQNAGGTAERIAKIQLNTLKGSFTIVRSAVNGLAIAITELANDRIRKFNDWLIKFINNMTRLKPVFGVLLTSIGTFLRGFGDIVKRVFNFWFGSMINSVKKMGSWRSAIVQIITGLSVVIAQLPDRFLLVVNHMGKAFVHIKDFAMKMWELFKFIGNSISGLWTVVTKNISDTTTSAFGVIIGNLKDVFDGMHETFFAFSSKKRAEIWARVGVSTAKRSAKGINTTMGEGGVQDRTSTYLANLVSSADHLFGKFGERGPDNPQGGLNDAATKHLKLLSDIEQQLRKNLGETQRSVLKGAMEALRLIMNPRLAVVTGGTGTPPFSAASAAGVAERAPGGGGGKSSLGFLGGIRSNFLGLAEMGDPILELVGVQRSARMILIDILEQERAAARDAKAARMLRERANAYNNLLNQNAVATPMELNLATV